MTRFHGQGDSDRVRKGKKAEKQHKSPSGRVGTTVDPMRMLRQVETALAGGQIDAACQILAQTHEVRASAHGRELAASAFAAQAFERWDRPARALTSLERALEAAPDDPQLCRLHGTALRRAGRLRSALGELDQAHRLMPDDPGVALEALLLHLAAGDRDQQLVTLAADNGTRTAALASALLSAAQGNVPAAEQTLARIQQPVAKLLRGITALAQGESHLALSVLRESATDESLPGATRAYASFYCGLAYLRRREIQPAAEALEKAQQLGLPKELVRNYLVWTYNQLVIDAVLDRDLARAADWLTNLSEEGGPTAHAARENVAYALRLYGQEKAQAGDYDEAARLWKQALEITPRDFVLRQNLAVALERADRADEAIPHWHELVQQLSKGAAKDGKGRRDGTDSTEDQALSIHVRAVAHRHLADLYLEEDDAERAIAQMERALAVVPDDADTRRTLAHVLIEQGSSRKALPHLERLIADRPDSTEVLIDIATAQRLLGNLDAAVKALERAYELEPNDPFVGLGLGTCSAARAISSPAAETAERDAQRALELLPRGKTLGLVALGAVQLARGKRKEALRTFKKCVKEAADKTNATIEVGRVYWQAGERELAAEMWSEAMKKAKRSPERFWALAGEWAKAGDVERCKECFKELLSRHLPWYAIDAAEAVVAAPQGKLFLRRVLAELIPWAPDVDARMFLAEGLLNAGDLSVARPLMNSIALESVATDDSEGVFFVTELDYKYRYKLLERRAAIAVAQWLDDHPPPDWAEPLGGTDGRR